ncbi:hypothetical protein PFISCL1PPCAC_25822 [Pristionchus fissidentatus]|uniref:Uncharacterized protein n=1 Tax=Pristionchus fissidentatus TaxID=1538716 RepID=A0AAV5WV90_9BILA|nr:hypothetical protein PFISCL1PPCAC_25822 [Pristionchus fissidentatus]
MEYPALMDASDMMADRLRDLETKNKKDAYAKDTEVRRQLEGVSRPAPTPDQEKEGIAKLKNAAPSMYNRSSLVTDSDVTTAEPVGQRYRTLP